MPMDRFLEIAFEDIGFFIMRSHEQVPARLHHFTSDLSKVESILGNREMWASHAYDMNDPRELRYGSHLIHERLREYRRRYGRLSLQLDQFFDMAMERDNPFDNPFNSTPPPFVISLCEDGSSDSQWQKYGNEGKGFCFNFDINRDGMGSLMAEKLHFLPVIYDPEVQLRLIDTAIQRQVNHLLRSAREDMAMFYGMNASCAFFYVAMLYASVFKSPYWRDEREWRLVRGLRSITPAPFHTLRIGDKERRFNKVGFRELASALALHDISCGSNVPTENIAQLTSLLSTFRGTET